MLRFARNDIILLCYKINLNEYSNRNGRSFANQFESGTIQLDKVVIKNASGLIRQQGGSFGYTDHLGAKKWIADFNHNGYAGYHDWRLPTLEESMSLIEPMQRNDDLYIDLKFDATQWIIWTSDPFQDSTRRQWVVDFGIGSYDHYFLFDYNYVRAVRFEQSCSE